LTVTLTGVLLCIVAACCMLLSVSPWRLCQLTYGYQLHQSSFNQASFKAVPDSFPDTVMFKVHNKNTLIMHPSPVMQLRLLLRHLLAAYCAADPALDKEKPPAAAAAAAEQPKDEVAAAVAAACAEQDVQGSLTVSPCGEQSFPVVVVHQQFKAVFGFEVPLQYLGVQHLKHLLHLLSEECDLAPCSEFLTAGVPNTSQAPDMWLVTAPKPGAANSFNEWYQLQLGAGKAASLTNYDPILGPVGPPSGEKEAAGSSSSRHGGSKGRVGAGSSRVIPALGGHPEASSAIARGGGGSSKAYGVTAAGKRGPDGGCAHGPGGLEGGRYSAAGRDQKLATVQSFLKAQLQYVPPAYGGWPAAG
jgi:hypothetical protein